MSDTVGQERRVVRPGHGVHRNAGREDRDQVVTRRRRDRAAVNSLQKTSQFRIGHGLDNSRDRAVKLRRERVERILEAQRNNDFVDQRIAESRHLNIVS